MSSRSARPGPEHTDRRDGVVAAAATAPQPDRSGIGLVDPRAAFAELGLIVLNEHPPGAVLEQIAQLAARTIPGADEVSVTLIERGHARSIAFSQHSRIAAALDERQYQDGYGPCMDAAVSGQLIAIEDTAHDRLYPGFSAQARRAGIRQTLAVGMPTLQQTTGALNVYSSGADLLDPATQNIATAFVGYAAVALFNVSLYAGAVEQVAQMHQAMASRAGIEQAKGILMRDRRCTPAEAFTILRTLSSESNRKLHDVAQVIVQDAMGR
jgi:GAF domain-containing protein